MQNNIVFLCPFNRNMRYVSKTGSSNPLKHVLRIIQETKRVGHTLSVACFCDAPSINSDLMRIPGRCRAITFPST